jgi:hypothetical protein
MNRPTCRRTWTRFLGSGSLALGILFLAPSVRAADTAVERIHAEIEFMRGWVSNAQAKLKNNAMGGAANEDPSAPTSPARLCCSNNLKKIDESQLRLQALLRELSECYESDNQPLGVSAVEFAKNDLLFFGKSVVKFAVAPTVIEAGGEIAVVTRMFLQLSETVDDLEPCPAVAEQNEKDKKKKDKKKKKKS